MICLPDTLSVAKRIEWQHVWSGEPYIAEQDKCDDLGWFAYNCLPQPIAPHILTALEHRKNNTFYSEADWAIDVEGVC